MTLRQTIMFFPKGETEVVKIEIYVYDDSSGDNGFWNVDTNKVALTPSLYSQFRSLDTQVAQRKFFEQLRKVSSTSLT
ncbi:hypothetical protein [Segetibacter koreensis]|uniref:hypothetical protein n=1 Tax=Segetibacter koreensis TaxID=398037 RepID=UPI00037255AE|nr:hypothetical protein [Segetibacter koreensis]